jgi:hypothetical protein
MRAEPAWVFGLPLADRPFYCADDFAPQAAVVTFGFSKTVMAATPCSSFTRRGGDRRETP